MYDQVAQNKRRSLLLLLCFLGLVLAVGAALNLLIGGGPYFMLFALLFAGGAAAFSYWKSDAIALRVSRARPASVEEYGRLHNLVEGLCIAGGLPKPRLYVVDGFAGWDPHANTDDPKRNPVYFYMGQFMKWLLIGVFSFFGIHTALWLYRSLRAMKGESR